MTIAWSLGASKHDADPEQREAPDFDSLIRDLDHIRAPAKDLAYFAAPFAENGTPGRGHRGRESVLPCQFIILDFDKLTPEILPDLKDWLKRYYGAGWPTHSATAAAPRLRAVLQLSRPATRQEIIHVNSVIAMDVREEFSIELDTSQFRPEQPAYMPPLRAKFTHFWGEPIDVDRCLTVKLPQKEPAKTSAEPADHGGRNNALTYMAGRLRRIGSPQDELLASLKVRNTSFSPPLADAEVEQIARSVARYEPVDFDPSAPETFPSPLDLASLSAITPVPPTFIIDNWLPQGEITLMGAHGGTGKSMVALEFACCIALGKSIFGMACEQRTVAFLSYEDSQEVLHWRLSRICTWLGIELRQLEATLKVYDLSRCLGSWFTMHRGEVGVTEQYLLAQKALSNTEVLIVDGSSDTFAANENDRGQVKSFMRALRKLIVSRGALLLIAHVDKLTARANGVTSQGYSGSTAWHNAPRARWYMYEAEDGSIIIELQKSNLGKRTEKIKINWDPSFHLFDGNIEANLTKLDSDIERTQILTCFSAAEKAGVQVPEALQGQRTAFHVLSSYPQFPTALKVGRNPEKRRFASYLEELRQIRHIEESSIRRSNRHLLAVLRLTSEGRAKCAEYEK